MTRRFRCRWTGAHRCQARATQRFAMRFNIVAGVQTTRMCPEHSRALISIVRGTGIELVKITRPRASRRVTLNPGRES